MFGIKKSILILFIFLSNYSFSQKIISSFRAGYVYGLATEGSYVNFDSNVKSKPGFYLSVSKKFRNKKYEYNLAFVNHNFKKYEFNEEYNSKTTTSAMSLGILRNIQTKTFVDFFGGLNTNIFLNTQLKTFEVSTGQEVQSNLGNKIYSSFRKSVPSKISVNANLGFKIKLKRIDVITETILPITRSGKVGENSISSLYFYSLRMGIGYNF